MAAVRSGLRLALGALALWLLLTLIGLLSAQPLGSAESVFRLYKGQQIVAGRLVFCRGWGWVDRRHRLEQVLLQLEAAGSQEFHINHWFFGSWGKDYALCLKGRCSQPEESWRCLQLLGERCEMEESRLPWYVASRISAYNADDLAAVYLTLFTRAYPDWKPVMEAPARSLERLQQDSRCWMEERIRSSLDFQPQDPALRPRFRSLFNRLERLRPRVDLVRIGPLAR